MSTSSSRRRHRRHHIKINSHQVSGVAGAGVLVVVAGRAMAGAAATWLDVVAVGVAGAVLVLLVGVPARRRRTTTQRRRTTQPQRDATKQLLSGGHPPWTPPAQARAAAAAPPAKQLPHQELRMRLAMAEELATINGYADQLREMYSAVHAEREQSE